MINFGPIIDQHLHVPVLNVFHLVRSGDILNITTRGRSSFMLQTGFTTYVKRIKKALRAPTLALGKMF